MKYVGLYHLNAYTYADPTWFPDMDPELRDMFNKVTIGSLSGKAGEKAKEDFKINGQYVNEPGKPVTLHGVTYPDGVVGIPFFDGYVEKAALEFLDTAAKEPGKPFFITDDRGASDRQERHGDQHLKQAQARFWAEASVRDGATVDHVGFGASMPATGTVTPYRLTQRRTVAFGCRNWSPCELATAPPITTPAESTGESDRPSA